MPQQQVELVLGEAFARLAQQEAAIAMPPRNLRLVLRHDCQ